jgi:hypothetical protein
MLHKIFKYLAHGVTICLILKQEVLKPAELLHAAKIDADAIIEAARSLMLIKQPVEA